MQAHEAHVLQQHPIHRHLLDRARREAHHHDPPIPRRAPQAFLHHAHWVENNVHALAFGGKLLDLRFPARRVVVDPVVRAVALCDLELAR